MGGIWEKEWRGGGGGQKRLLGARGGFLIADGREIGGGGEKVQISGRAMEGGREGRTDGSTDADGNFFW